MSIFHDEYSGPRWTYGLTYRPLSTYTVPRGYIIWSDKKHPLFNFGTIDYPRELTPEEMEQFQLTLVETCN